MRKYLFVCFLVLSLLDGYAQFWKGFLREGIRRTLQESSSKKREIPRIGEMSDSTKSNFLKQARKFIQFEDSMYTIAETDSFGIYCRVCSGEINPKGIMLRKEQIQQYNTCSNYFIKYLINDKDQFYRKRLEKRIPHQTVQSLYNIVMLHCPSVRE